MRTKLSQWLPQPRKGPETSSTPNKLKREPIMTLPSVKRLPYLRRNLVQRRKSEISAGFNLRSENKEGLNIFKNPLVSQIYRTLYYILFAWQTLRNAYWYSQYTHFHHNMKFINNALLIYFIKHWRTLLIHMHA